MNRSKPVVFTQLFEFQSILVITIYKVFGQKFSLYREGSRLFMKRFVFLDQISFEKKKN